VLPSSRRKQQKGDEMAREDCARPCFEEEGIRSAKGKKNEEGIKAADLYKSFKGNWGGMKRGEGTEIVWRSPGGNA